MPLIKVEGAQLPTRQRVMPEVNTRADVRLLDLLEIEQERESWIGNLIPEIDATPHINDPALGVDPDYDPFEDMAGYETYAEYLMEAENPIQMRRLKQKIDERQAQDATFADGSLAGQLAVGAAVAATDPLSYLGFSAGLKATTGLSRIARGVAAAGAGAGVGQAATEVMLQATDPLRTSEESLNNIAATTILGGMLGGAAAALSRPAAEALAVRVKTDMQRAVLGRSEVGAARAETTLEQETLVGAAGLEKALQLDPISRMANSPSLATRKLNQALNEQPLEYKKAAEGIAQDIPLEAYIKQYDGLRISAYNVLDGAFKAYRGTKTRAGAQVRDLARLGDKEKLTYSEFKRAVYRSMRRGDRSDIPEVQQVAEALRKDFVEPVRQRAIKAGLLTGDETVGTAESWIMRVWDKDKINARPNQFNEVNAQWLRQKRDAARVKETELEQVIAQMTEQLSDAKLEQRTLKRKAKAAQKANEDIVSLRNEISEAQARIDEIRKEQERLLSRKTRSAADKRQFKSLSKRKDELREIQNKAKSKLDAKQQQYDNLVDEVQAGAKADAASIREQLDAAKADYEKARFYAGFDDVELDSVVGEIRNRITSTDIGRLPYDYKIRGEPTGRPSRAQYRGSLRERVYDIPDEMVEEFLLDDLDVFINSYIRSVGIDSEVKLKFGDLDMQQQLKNIELEYEQLIRQAKTEKEARNLKRRMNADLRDAKATLERQRGIYALPENYDGTFATAERLAMQVNYTRLLGGMVVSAIPDVGRVAMRHGVKRAYGNLIGRLFSDKKGLKELAKELDLAGVEELVLSSRARAFADIEGYIPGAKKVEQGFEVLSGNFAKLTGMAHWNDALKNWAGFSIQSRMLDAIDGVLAGTADKKAVRFLAENYIDKDMAARIAKQVNEHGVQYNKVRLPNTAKWTDEDAVLAYRAAVRREVDITIVTPGQDKPLFMSRPGIRLLGQFKSFGFSSLQRTFLSGIQKRDATTLAGVAQMVALGALVYVVKSYQYGSEPDMSVDRLITEGIDRSGVLGILIDGNNIVEKVSRGRVGISALTGAPIMSRYASRSALEALFGPTYGTIGEIARVTGAAAAGDFNRGDVEALRRLMPYQNVWYLRGLFDDLEQGLANTIGVEK